MIRLFDDNARLQIMRNAAVSKKYFLEVVPKALAALDQSTVWAGQNHGYLAHHFNAAAGVERADPVREMLGDARRRIKGLLNGERLLEKMLGSSLDDAIARDN